MNVLFTWINPVDPESGGVERVTFVIMNGLLSRGYQCLFLECKNDYTDLIYNGTKILNFNKFLLEKKIDVVINQDGYSAKLSKLIELTGWKGRYYIFFHNDPQMFSHLFSFQRVGSEVLNSKSAKKNRMEWFLRGMFYPIWRINALYNIRLMFCYNYKQASKYILLSTSFNANFIKTTGLSEFSKLCAIPNPLSFQCVEDENIIANKKKEVLIVTRLFEPEKRVSHCLKIWQQIEQNGFEDWQLKIVGYGPDEENYKKMTDEMGLKRVSFMGRQDSYPYYCRASIFMMTSRFEGWGLTLTESLQTGVVPIVMDSYPSINDIITHQDNGIIVPNNNIPKFVLELQDLMTNEYKREEMAKRALKSAFRFSLSNVLDKWDSLLKN